LIVITCKICSILVICLLRGPIFYKKKTTPACRYLTTHPRCVTIPFVSVFVFSVLLFCWYSIVARWLSVFFPLAK
jgi:hypothetical protein